jgi:hypothetical protein
MKINIFFISWKENLEVHAILFFSPQGCRVYIHRNDLWQCNIPGNEGCLWSAGQNLQGELPLSVCYLQLSCVTMISKESWEILIMYSGLGPCLPQIKYLKKRIAQIIMIISYPQKLLMWCVSIQKSECIFEAEKNCEMHWKSVWIFLRCWEPHQKTLGRECLNTLNMTWVSWLSQWLLHA